MALATQAAYIDTPYPPAGYHHLPSQPSAIDDGRTDGPKEEGEAVKPARSFRYEELQH